MRKYFGTDGIRGIAFNNSDYTIQKRSGKQPDGMEHISESLMEVNKLYKNTPAINRELRPQQINPLPIAFLVHRCPCPAALADRQLTRPLPIISR